MALFQFQQPLDPSNPTGDVDPGFARWYALYPRREAKGDARKAWKRLRPTKDLELRMIAALEQQLLWREPQFFPRPDRWIERECWEDEPLAKPTPKPDSRPSHQPYVPMRQRKLED
jgi:hypothetical protein